MAGHFARELAQTLQKCSHFKNLHMYASTCTFMLAYTCHIRDIGLNNFPHKPELQIKGVRFSILFLIHFILFFKRNTGQGQGESSLYKVLVLQVQGPEFGTQSLCNPSLVWRHMFIKPILITEIGRCRQTDSWGLICLVRSRMMKTLAQKQEEQHLKNNP